MDWIALITMLITTILPLIINKGFGANKVALQRRQIRYDKLADAALASGEVMAAFALGEAAELCGCLAGAESQAAQQQILAAGQDAFQATKAALAGKAA